MRALPSATLHRGMRGLAVAVLAASLLALAASAIVQVRGGQPSDAISANAALCTALLAASWLVPTGVARACAVAVLAVAGCTLAEFALGVDLGIDTLLYPDASGEHGRIRLTAALCLVPLAVVRLLPIPGRRANRVVEVLSAVVLAIAVVAALGYVFDVSAPPGGASIAFLPPGASCALIALAVIAMAAVPDGFAAWVATGPDLGALMLRRVLPIAVVAVPAVSVGVVLLMRSGLLEPALSAPIATVTVMAVVIAAVGYTAAALRRADRARTEASDALAAVNADLGQRVLERAAALQAERDTNAVLVDRERIAADMHDLVIQRLYAVGLDLQARVTDDTQSANALNGIDDAIADLRRSIFDLKNSPAAGTDIAGQLRELADGAAAAFEQPPDLHVAGDLDNLPAMHATHLLAVAREAVSNAVRHSGATRLSIQLTSDQTGLTLTVTDNGRGVPEGTDSVSGLRNIRDRATQLDGMAAWHPTRHGGTSMVWRVPHAEPETEAPASPPQQMTDAVLTVAALLPNGLRADRLGAVGAGLREIAGADAVTGVLPETDHLRLCWVAGLATDPQMIGSTYAYQGTLTGHVATTGRPLRLADVADVPGRAHDDQVRPYGPVLAIPVQGAGADLHGVVILLRARGAAPFTPRDEERAVCFATIAGVLLDQYRTAPASRMEWDFTALTGLSPSR